MTAAAQGRLVGIGVSSGVAAGPVARMARLPDVVPGQPPSRDPVGEAEAVLAALEAVAQDLGSRAARAGGEAAQVLEATAMFATDPALARSVRRGTEQGQGGVDAVTAAFAQFRERLAAAGPYLAARVTDLDDVRDRVLAHLLGVPVPGIPDRGAPFVLVAEDLAPADAALLDRATVLALVTEKGGPTSHTAILAKSLGLPAVIACPDANQLTDGVQVLVDGGTGIVLVAPSVDQLRAAEETEQTRRAALTGSTGPGRTRDGHHIELLVNLGALRDLPAAAAADAEGVGLFRTEFLFLDRPDAPSPREQEAAYVSVFEAFAGRKVVVRTLDAGADKPLQFATLPDEPNPALGVRGLRTTRRLPELLITQLAAVAAAAHACRAQVWVMAPMVSTPAEAGAFVAQAHAAGLPHAGVMVEVPAAALRAGAVAAATDFLSIGTNDLAQYAFAADRMAAELVELLDPWQPALLDLVRLTVQGGAAAGRPVGVCGEAASDPLLAPVLAGLGVTSLSMAPGSLAGVRIALAALTLAQCQGLAELALGQQDGVGARAAVAAALQR